MQNPKRTDNEFEDDHDDEEDGEVQEETGAKINDTFERDGRYDPTGGRRNTDTNIPTERFRVKIFNLKGGGQAKTFTIQSDTVACPILENSGVDDSFNYQNACYAPGNFPPSVD